MSGRRKFAIASVAAIGVAVATGAVLGVGSAAPPSRDPSAGRTSETARVHLTGSRSEAVPNRAAASAKGARPGIAFLETHGVSVPAGRSKIRIGPTPRRCRTINGYYFVPGEDRTKIASEGDSPARHRFWKFYRNNRTGRTIRGVVYGVVCVRGLRLLG
jgi:hypothetical protein